MLLKKEEKVLVLDIVQHIETKVWQKRENSRRRWGPDTAKMDYLVLNEAKVANNSQFSHIGFIFLIKLINKKQFYK